MTSFLRKLWWGTDPDVPNEISGLSLRDINLIKKSWAPVYADAGNNGLLMFLMFFRKDLETQNFFDKVRDKTEEEISANTPFQAHILNVMSSLNTAITHLKEPEVVIEIMKDLGDKHREKKIKEIHFEEFKEVIIEIFSKILKLDNKTLGAWGRFIAFIYSAIYERLNVVE